MEGESKLKKNIGNLIILTIAGSLIYGLPYFRTYFYDDYLEVYNLTNTQMGLFGSIFGILGAVSYLFGGVVADMVSTRKILCISLILSGLAGFLHLGHPGFGMLVLIYALWGFTTLFAFWPALLKALREISGPTEQSKATGLMDAGRGLLNALHASAIVAIFAWLSAKANAHAGMNGVIIFYAAIVIILGILLWFFLPEESATKEEGKKSGFDWANVGKAIKHPAVWILSACLFCTYTMNIAYWYFTPYATAILGVTAAGAAIILSLAQWIRPVSSALGGIVGDKIGRSKIFIFSFVVMAIGTFMIAFSGSMSTPLFIVIVCCIYFAMYADYSLAFSMLEEGGVPIELSGAAIGIVCTVGYLPEVLAPLAAGPLLDKYGDLGYKYYFMGVGILMCIGIVMVLVWNRYHANMKKTEAK